MLAVSLLLLKDYLSYLQCIMGKRIMERFFGFHSSTQPQESCSSDTPYLLLSPNTAQDFYATSTQRGHFDIFPSTLPRLLFVFSHLIKLSIVDMCTPALLFPWLYSWSSISPLWRTCNAQLTCYLHEVFSNFSPVVSDPYFFWTLVAFFCCFSFSLNSLYYFVFLCVYSETASENVVWGFLRLSW